MDDPYVTAARALKRSLDAGLIDQARYDAMYAALARACELDAIRCEVCEDTAYIGARCARHFDRATLPGIVAEMRGRV